MLTAETKRNIDAARDVLVGKVPDPKAQVEQITTALIYKFMDDLDREAAGLGGQAQFFTGEYERYAWSSLLDTRLSGEGRLDLYVQAIKSMERNPGLPQLFRDIFKGAFLPYNDPQTLALFLKEINKFTYEHSEELGNAFEYLLSVLGSQGDAGQFRTPRHIIDFMVAAVDPRKHETILDPACGTAGFLISAYKHIRRHNTSTYQPHAINKAAEPAESAPALTLADKAIYDGDQLAPQERERLAQNIQGYDISPDMVRLSLVNLYLHGFNSPRVYEYDTLTSEERWDDTFDVILANPPFMSPKGGIRPHRRFQVQANRSEVLFVDYILEHLNPNGRAAVIVPEGVIFKSDNAYKALRRLLLDDGLLAVVSLPPGVFNPYSGVKTSILFFNNQVARRVPDLLFLRVDQDGFDLGAQRRKIEADDLPEALRVLRAWMGGEKQESPLALWVDKDRVAADGDYNLGGERYRKIEVIGKQKWPMVILGEIAEYINGYAFKPIDWKQNGKKIIRIQNLTKTSESYNFVDRDDIPEKYVVKKGDLLISWSATIGFYIWNDDDAYLNQHIFKVIPKENILKQYLYILKNKIIKDIVDSVHGNTMQHITKGRFESIKIPLPPLDVQRDIVEQIQVKQAAINAAKAVIANLEKERRFFGRELAGMEGVEWVPLGEVFEKIDDNINPQKEKGEIVYIGLENIESNTGFLTGKITTEIREIKSTKTRFREMDILYGKLRPNLNKVWLSDKQGVCSTDIYVLRRKIEGIEPMIYAQFLKSELFNNQVLSGLTGAQLPRVNFDYLSKIKIPIFPSNIIKNIIKEIETQDNVITSNLGIIEIMEQKIVQVLENI